MTLEDLILNSPDKVRGDSNLMRAYIDIYTGIYGSAPSCTGCTFKTDFKKLLNYAHRATNLNTPNVMKKSEKTFKLKKINGTIHTYKNGKNPVRMYDNRMTEDFAVAYLTNGTKKEIEQRKQYFEVLPTGVLSKKEAKAEPKAEPKAEAAEPKAAEPKAAEPKAAEPKAKAEAAEPKAKAEAAEPKAEAAEPKAEAKDLTRDELKNILREANIDFNGNAKTAHLRALASNINIL